jgi:hypothetical protein
MLDEIPPKLKIIWTWFPKLKNSEAKLKERGKYVFTAKTKTLKVEKQ